MEEEKGRNEKEEIEGGWDATDHHHVTLRKDGQILDTGNSEAHNIEAHLVCSDSGDEPLRDEGLPTRRGHKRPRAPLVNTVSCEAWVPFCSFALWHIFFSFLHFAPNWAAFYDVLLHITWL